jgi:hypothetical protein
MKQLVKKTYRQKEGKKERKFGFSGLFHIQVHSPGEAKMMS